MADVISMDEKRRLSDQAKADIVKKRKLLAVRKVFHCTRCRMKCEKCGTQIGMSQSEPDGQPARHLPYQFCESCADEYADYIERLKGGGDSDCYWHNESWLGTWRTWIDYKGAMDRHVRSKEFLKLIDEIKNNKSNK